MAITLLLRLVFWCCNFIKASHMSIEHCRFIYVTNRVELAPTGMLAKIDLSFIPVIDVSLSQESYELE